MTPRDLLRVADLMPEACLLLGSGGMVHALNPAARQLGLGEGPFAGGAPAQQGRARDLFAAASRSRSMVPGRLLLPDGSSRVVRAGLLVPAGEPHGPLVLVRFERRPHVDGFSQLNRQIERLQREIAQRRASEDGLAAERERLSVTLASIGDAVLATDTEGRVVLMNAVAEQLTGYTQAEAQGRPLGEIFRIFNERTGEVAFDPVAHVLRTGQVVGLANHTALISKDGVTRSIADSAAPIRDRNGLVLGVVLVFRDVTTEKRVEEEMARASRLDSVGMLAGGIAHDFNNILTAVIANLSLAEARLPDSHPARQRMAAAGAACQRARDLTQQLLTFARGGAPVKALIALDSVLREACTFALQGSRSRFDLRLMDDLWPVDGDPGQLHQVAHNIALNASQAMPQGGILTVDAANVVLEHHVVGALEAGRYVRLTFVDDGPGIPRDVQDQVFDPFFTTKGGGNGLGLATVYSVVHRHDGHVQVDNEDGRGARFTIHLPAADGEAAEVRRARTEATPGAGRVLVMDDDPFVRELVCSMLSELGYEPVGVPDGDACVAAFEQARANGGGFDLAILDLTVAGGRGGLETIALLLALEPRLPAIVSSGYSSDPVMSRYRSHGFVGVLPKPYRLEDLSRAVSAALLRPVP